ncbi:genetic suppressor element 1 isoform X3 [Bufo bufo]|uniref:genetic suppressor element 1 isoform X3 n=1 Tax=Bufo bufo TaxID=8384 RepID=UPI001ABDA411|nr:genetic suppressor element 1 isoform X3 [Bufo bufo]
MTDAPRSRKQRLMAAVEEEAAAPGAGDGVLYCFICGGGVPRGREVRLPVRCPAREGCAFFPFLQQQEPAPGAEPLSPGGSARVCAVCQRFLGAQWDAFERSRTPLEKRMYWLKRPYQCGGDGARAHPRDWNPNYDSELSDLSDNPLSDPEEGAEPPRRAPPHSAPCGASPPDRALQGAETENGHPGGSCYICGAPGPGHLLHVQKQEHNPQAPFFPFLWLHSPPPGASPITPGGSARACDSCFSSLMQQWHSFDMANVPVLQRLYVVPLTASPGPEKGTPPRLSDTHPKGPGLCHLCGEDCANQGRLVRSRISNGNAKSTMHFPFITQLPCPPGSRGLSHQGEAQSCRKCYGVLEDIWAIYRASQSEELITSVQSFLSRYHQVFSSTDASPPGSTPTRRAGVRCAPSVCYVCGAELAPGCEYQLSINPPNKFANKEPFFPFLTVYPPAPRARPADSTGLVSTCGLCYHDLLGQWFQHEMKTQHPSSPWSRQYQVESFVCFFCRQEKRRLLGLRSVQLARLPIFLLARRTPYSLFVDDGKHLLVGACTECKPLALMGTNVVAHSGASTTSSPATSQTCSAASRILGPSSSTSKVTELEQKPKTAKDPSTLSHIQKSCSDAERAEPGTTGSSISSESSPVSSPATNHSSPASTPKRGPMGSIIVPPAGHTVPNTPPVVTIAPTKTVNGVWRSEARQQSDNSSRANSISRERLIAESQLSSEKTGAPAVPAHLLGSTYAFAIPPSSVVQDSRFQPLNLQRQVHHVVPPSTVTEEYLRSFRPYHTAEDLRMPSLPHLGLDPTAAAAYYHNSYLAHHTFTHPAFRMEDSYCLSALRSPFYPLHSPGSLQPLHPSAMHLHLSGVRYPADLAHSSLSALQSERLTAERLQMDEELRQREREREREREKEREADREREKEREREREREKKEMEREKERERERELERQRERTREKEASLIKSMESQYLAEAEVHPLRMHQEERVKPTEQPAPTRPEKLKEQSVQTPKPVQHQMHQPPSTHHSVPSLISNHTVFPPANSAMAASMLAQRTQEEEKWLARQRRLRQEKEDRQYQVSEFRQQVLEQQLDASGRPINPQEAEPRPENLRVLPTRNEGTIREPLQHFGGPPPLISPKPPQHSVPTSLWNPVSLMDTPSESRRSQEPASIHNHTATIYEHSRPILAPVKLERPYSFEKQQLEEEDLPRRKEQTEKYQPIRESCLEHTAYSHAPFLAELEKSTQSFLNQQRSSLQQAGQMAETTLLHKPNLSHRPPPTRTRDPMYIYDEFLQQHRRLVSKLDLEERRRKEAREKGYYYDLDDSYDESDEEEVRAHLRRVAEQPPLKLDTSSEKLEFLQIFSLTTQQEKERILQQKRRKRRRMLRERSQSPPIQSKRQTPSPHSPLSTRFSPDELNNSPNLEEKKKFLTFFDLSHVSVEQRKDKEKLVEMLQTMKQKSAAPEAVKIPPLTSCRGSSPLPTGAPSEDQSVVQPPMQPEASAPVPSTSSSTVTAPEPVKPPELIRQEQPKLSDRLAPLPVAVPAPSSNVVSTEKVRQNEAAAPAKKSLSILNIVRGHPAKENPVQASQSVNGRNKSWEPFIAEEFAHQFHESVLQSTQKALQKHKGASALNCAEQNHKPDASVHYNIPELQQSSRPPAPQQNGPQGPGQSGVVRGTIHPDVTSEEETSDEDDDDEEEDEADEPPRPKWQGIEAIFEAYQEHIEEQNLERQVLETQCKRLEAQHYNLSLTAEQISHRMADLMSQKQKVASERERLQAELEHFRKCLVLLPSPWSRGYFKGHPR